MAGQVVSCPVDCYQDERELTELLERVREIRPGGIMAFHDAACCEEHPSIDVGAWWNDLMQTGIYRQELISYIPHWWGIGVIYK